MIDVGKKIRKQEGAKAGALLGYTTSAKPVYVRTRAPEKDTKVKFPGWTQEDHEDAFQLHKEAAEVAKASGNQKLASHLESWGREHAGRQEAPTEMTKAAHVKVRAMLRKLIKSEWSAAGPDGFNERRGERAAERAVHAVTKSLGSLLGGVKLAARGGLDDVEIWNQTGSYDAPEFSIDLVTGRVS